MAATIRRVVHSSVLLEFDGARILTDPWLSERRGYYQGEKRAYELASDLPELAGVVISHGHYDHCDLDAFASYPDKTVPFAVAPGVATRVRAAGFSNVVKLRPWQSTTLGPVRVTATPAQHGVPEVTFVIEGGGKSVFFGGDTERITALDEVGERFGDLDLALLPINGLRIRPAFNKKLVMDARDAADLARVLRPRLAVPIHYAYTAGPVRDRLLLKLDRNRTDLFETAVAEAAPGTAVHVLSPGEPLTL